MTDEEWLPVVGYEGLYAVSTHGRVRSVERTAPMRHRGTGEMITRRVPAVALKAHPAGRYLSVSLSDGHNKQRTMAVHLLVLEAFRGPRPPGMKGCHWDDNLLNNHLSNLRWDTQSANELDKVRNGLHPGANAVSCINGHDFTPENTRIYRGKRKCLACVQIRNQHRKVTP